MKGKDLMKKDIPKKEVRLDLAEATVTHANYSAITINQDDVQLVFAVRDFHNHLHAKATTRVFMSMSHLLDLKTMLDNVFKDIEKQAKEHEEPKRLE